jgi:hypothetical protein
MKKLQEFVNRRLFPLQYVETKPTVPERISIFKSRVVVLAVSGAIASCQPALENVIVNGKMSKADLFSFGRALALVAGVVSYRYSVDDTQYYTPSFLPGANKGDRPS